MSTLVATQKRINNKIAYVNLAFLLLLCFILATCFIALIFNFKVNVEEIEEQTSNFVITAKQISLPTEEDFNELKESYNELLADFSELKALKEEIESLYSDVETAKVCSKANKYFNSLEDCFNSYQEKLNEIEGHISSYEEMYNSILNSIEEIPKCSHLYNENYNEFINSFASTYSYIHEQNQLYIANKETICSLYINAKEIADTLFEEYFDLLSRLVTREAGNCSAEEQSFVANVVENRIEDSRFPDNLYDVIYSPGQYAPVISGSINNPAYESVKQNMELYLRGHMETCMPSNVVFQARFEQGDDIWKEMPSGHYFCILY